MQAQVTVCRDPFRLANHRSVDVVRRRKSLRNLAPKVSTPFICMVNGRPISRKAWARRVNDGDSVVFVTLPQGGGGSNPLKLVLMLAISMIAPSAVLATGGQFTEYAYGITSLTSMGRLAVAGISAVGPVHLIKFRKESA